MKAIGALVVVGASVVGGLMGYGMYGHFRDKGDSSWKAGAKTGAINGAIGALALLAMPADMLRQPTGAEQLTGVYAKRLAGTRGVYAQRVGNLTMSSVPKGIGILAAQKLAGCNTCP